MKKVIFILFLCMFSIMNSNAQVKYTSEMSNFIGTWVQPKVMDYDGVQHISIKKIDDLVIIKAKSEWPNDLPTPVINVPISEVSFSNGTFYTYGKETRMPIEPEHKLIITYQKGELHLVHMVRNKENDWGIVIECNLIEDY